MHSLIITGGGFQKSFTRSYIKKHIFDQVIAADHGVQYAVDLNIVPDYILGDFDSLDESVQKKMREWNVPIETFPPEKDYTDTHLAVLKAIENGADEITIIGGIGTRMDHTWANIGLLTIPLEKEIRAWIVDEHNRISMWNHDFTLEKSKVAGPYISFIPYTEKVTELTLKGFYYPLENETLTLGISRGISNELVEETGKVEIGSGLLLMIEAMD